MLFASSEEEYRNLYDIYSRMSDGELRVLRSSYGDLTEVAQSVFRDELKRRGISISEVHVNEQAEAEKKSTEDVDPDLISGQILLRAVYLFVNARQVSRPD